MYSTRSRLCCTAGCAKKATPGAVRGTSTATCTRGGPNRARRGVGWRACVAVALARETFKPHPRRKGGLLLLLSTAAAVWPRVSPKCIPPRLVTHLAQRAGLVFRRGCGAGAFVVVWQVVPGWRVGGGEWRLQLPAATAPPCVSSARVSKPPSPPTPGAAPRPSAAGTLPHARQHTRASWPRHPPKQPITGALVLLAFAVQDARPTLAVGRGVPQQQAPAVGPEFGRDAAPGQLPQRIDVHLRIPRAAWWEAGVGHGGGAAQSQAPAPPQRRVRWHHPPNGSTPAA